MFDHTFELTLSTPEDDEQPCLVGIDILELVRYFGLPLCAFGHGG